MEIKYRSNDMLIDICFSRSRAKQLLHREKEYNVLLKHLVSKDYLSDKGFKPPSVKEFCKMSKLSPNRFRNYLRKIHFDLVQDDFNIPPYTTAKVKYYVHIYGEKEVVTIEFQHLAHIPNVGDRMAVNGVKSVFGTNSFFVQSVEYEILDDTEVVSIALKTGIYNQYWELRKQRAIMLSEIPPMDFLNKNDYELRAKLNNQDYK